MCDDLFNENDNDRKIADVSWKKTIDGITKEGFRVGHELGEEESLQDGFNQAFCVASSIVYPVSELRGHISGKLAISLMKPELLNKTQEKRLEELREHVLNYEKDLLSFSEALFSDTIESQNSLMNPDEKFQKSIDSNEDILVGENVKVDCQKLVPDSDIPKEKTVTNRSISGNDSANAKSVIHDKTMEFSDRFHQIMNIT